MQRVLVVDDEPAIVTLLAYNLKKADYAVTTATDGVTALKLASEQQYDFILLDLMLPELDGMEVTKRLRQEKIQTPIIILTAKDDELDKIIGLELGADDYLTKPFSPREVLARMKAINRRLNQQAEAQQVIKIGELVIDPDNYTVSRGGVSLNLTPREYQLLIYFAKRQHRVLSREHLLNGVWGYDYAGQTRMVDIQISHLRDKIEIDPKTPKYLVTVRGFGYKLEEPQDETN
ncbi:response regulator transcription factor [Loigolactobacillus backii]|uniref:DNA-binding response regulator n=1 Tax=Loigolactobacillus backii TaxID=375175 RepID=A0A192H5R1_9LACO|nr:response regulator transcription factor [Loigolactobacillus backii]ANK59989.1 DNA-binding response regulator [Loigolactobacillus backii]ANK63326.1 DNA-binding response regulator [Loigolactobacillus backii]ANK64923.1 DNA-binding response regulator [Loigolactobacillus backii]ANK66630.1 DNA-binding response regulator [Loigolactobacillus backii]ANK69669.1 DNA-binding response regulator [Loigolactobacillus backii]